MRSELARGTKWRHTIQPPASNLKKLKWDDKLAKKAARWAKKCKSPKKHPKNISYGQNCAALPIEEGYHDQANRAIEEWMNESDDFNGNLIYSLPEHKNSKRFAQLALANARKIGCAIQRCNNGDEIFKGKNKAKEYDLVVCNYNKKPKVGKEIYKKGKGCSGCKKCWEGHDLCLPA
ncbi:unnamed protein product [Bursaphelenchus xylophilus]|uniref:(pine wood nematode) hypothetical protein n=1 Tax=Bursaphelenchus xylophilus TaxID=6326 RepID=A0A1I7SL50_BURXY|nr:unnamed protein product [Bursaphelenchus xylophilus]CAG9129369.1 unnamed protein product [Bursaphelenchus xylophilus]